MQIEGKDSSREGTQIEEMTTTFIAGPYSSYDTVFSTADTIFEVDFWARFSRFFFLGTDFEVCTDRTTAWKPRQKT